MVKNDNDEIDRLVDLCDRKINQIKNSIDQMTSFSQSKIIGFLTSILVFAGILNFLQGTSIPEGDSISIWFTGVLLILYVFIFMIHMWITILIKTNPYKKKINELEFIRSDLLKLRYELD